MSTPYSAAGYLGAKAGLDATQKVAAIANATPVNKMGAILE
jgi:hypothetical protein|tara:strand:+ start:459 stop:581 length:123 start_codon:yes stop_codon:yes gene_type:complete